MTLSNMADVVMPFLGKFSEEQVFSVKMSKGDVKVKMPSGERNPLEVKM